MSHLSLDLSFFSSVVFVCWPPSSSIIILFSKQTKSTIKFPIGCCLLNLRPSNCFDLRCRHKNLSSFVDLFRKAFAMLVNLLTIFQTPPPFPPPSRGRKTIKCLFCFLFQKEALIYAHLKYLCPIN